MTLDRLVEAIGETKIVVQTCRFHLYGVVRGHVGKLETGDVIYLVEESECGECEKTRRRLARGEG